MIESGYKQFPHTMMVVIFITPLRSLCDVLKRLTYLANRSGGAFNKLFICKPHIELAPIKATNRII